MSIDHLLPNAKALIDEVVKNPALFHAPELSFLASFHATFIAPPEPQAGCPHDHAHAHSHDQAAPEASRFEEASEPSDDEEEEEVRAHYALLRPFEVGSAMRCPEPSRRWACVPITRSRSRGHARSRTHLRALACPNPRPPSCTSSRRTGRGPH